MGRLVGHHLKTSSTQKHNPMSLRQTSGRIIRRSHNDATKHHTQYNKSQITCLHSNYPHTEHRDKPHTMALSISVHTHRGYGSTFPGNPKYYIREGLTMAYIHIHAQTQWLSTINIMYKTKINAKKLTPKQIKVPEKNKKIY